MYICTYLLMLLNQYVKIIVVMHFIILHGETIILYL